MSVKEILFIALHDMGVADAIMDALPELSKRYKLHIFAKEGFAYKALQERFSDVELSRFNTLGYNKITVGDARIILKYVKPDFVLTGVSNIYREYEGQVGVIHKGDFSFCEVANKVQIPTIGVLEAFSMSNKLIKARFNKSRSLPRELVVQNVDMKKKISAFGFFKEKSITVCTMPKYARFANIANKDKEKIRADILKVNGLEDGFIIFYSTSATPEEDFPALKYLADEIKNRKDVRLLLGIHPKDLINPEFLSEMKKIVPNGIIADYGSYDNITAVSALTSGDKGLYMGVKTIMLMDVALTKANLANINLNNNKEYSKNFNGLSREIKRNKKDEISKLIDEIKTGGCTYNPETIKQYDAPDAVKVFCDMLDDIVRGFN